MLGLKSYFITTQVVGLCVRYQPAASAGPEVLFHDLKINNIFSLLNNYFLFVIY